MPEHPDNPTTGHELAAEDPEIQRRRVELLMAELGWHFLNTEAKQLHPRDLYLQTAHVLGYDPLDRVARNLTAERFSR